MEIINLKTGARIDAQQTEGGGDFVNASDGTNDANGFLLKITDIKQAVKNENRVNVFINDKYSFSLDIAQVVELGVKVGRIISEAELLEFKRASEFGKLYQRALEWVLIRPRSEKETRDYLYRKIKSISSGVPRGNSSNRKIMATPEGLKLGQAPLSGPEGVTINLPIQELSQAVISRLKSRGYLDDEKFARWYVENRFVKKGVSKKRLEMELIKKGVKVENVEEFLDARDDPGDPKYIVTKRGVGYFFSRGE